MIHYVGLCQDSFRGKLNMFCLFSYKTGNRDTAVPAEGNCDLQTLICVLVARSRRCPILSNPVQCPLTKLNGSLSPLYSADEDAVSWLTSYGS